jgi:hypothetical protein
MLHRVCAASYFFIAFLYVVGGLHSIPYFIGWLTMATGFLLLSFADKDANPPRPRLRGPAYSFMAVGIGLLAYGAVTL